MVRIGIIAAKCHPVTLGLTPSAKSEQERKSEGRENLLLVHVDAEPPRYALYGGIGRTTPDILPTRRITTTSLLRACPWFEP